MTNEEKNAPVITGFILYILAAFVSVGLLTQIPSLGSGFNTNANFFVSFANILVRAYGYSSILIPVFLLVAGTFCFLDKWNRQKAVCLLISVIPFFTCVFAERLFRKSAVLDTGIVAVLKAVSVFLITAVVVVVEYLVASIIAGRFIKPAEEKSSVEKEMPASDTEDSTAETIVEPAEENAVPKKTAEAEPVTEIETDSKDEDEISKAVDESVNLAIKSDWTLKELLARKKKDNEISKEETPVTESVVTESEKANPEADLAVEAEPEATETAAELETEETPVTETVTIEEDASEPVTVNDSEKLTVEPEVNLTETLPQNNVDATSAESDEDEIDVNSDPWNISGKGKNIKFLGKVVKQSRKNAAEEYRIDSSNIKFDSEKTNDDVQPDPEPVTIELRTDTSNAPYEEETINTEILSDVMNSFETKNDSTEENTDSFENNDFVNEEDPAGLVEDSFEIEEDADGFETEDDSVEPEETDVPEEDVPAAPQEAGVYGAEDIFGEDPFSVFNEIDDAVQSETKPVEKKTELKETVVPQKEIPADVKTESHSLLSSLDSVFARMDKDAMADVVASENNVSPAVNENDFDIEQSVPVTSVSSLISKTNSAANTSAVKQEQPKPVHKKIKRGVYKIPYDLLTEYTENPYWIIDEETNAAAQNLKDTMNEFKIEAEITGIKKGPVVTMFEMLPAPGVKLSKIVALQDNIALRLAASSVRIVAPIPGKRAVGIEVPNAKRAIVSFRECIEQNRPEWKKMSVPVVLGKDIQGETQIMDLVKTPHLLIAGSTGAGKSVCVNSMILSILYKRSPNEVKMILIDPKIVELKLYNDIPHLLTPVITESKKAMQALQYCLCEMERRYALLDGLGVRDISNYNKRIEERKICTEKLPYIVVIIDEFADLMATTGKELESVVARLAAMSRAVGIHLVLATQRPSIDVITGLIKANIPSRIAFMVASKTDSRIIIDQVGADKLLGKGDMLYASATDPFPVRIQGTFISDNEVEAVVESVKEWGEPDYIDDEIFIDDEDDGGDGTMSLFNPGGEDPLYEKALDVVIQAGKASASYIQRRLKIGYNRAARLVEEMEERGIVGPANGSKPREIIHMP